MNIKMYNLDSSRDWNLELKDRHVIKKIYISTASILKTFPIEQINEKK